MKLYRTTTAIYADDNGTTYRLTTTDWDALLNSDDVVAAVNAAKGSVEAITGDVLTPVSSQEVWASGVTYYRSRNARMEESQAAGGGDFYDRVYAAERPELFYKASAWRVVHPGGEVRIRKDATWSIPEPELTLVANKAGKLIGLTIGNDMSSRDIEGENPLYLPQAKVYNGSCAVGPCILLWNGPVDRATRITLEIARDGATAVSGSTTLAELKRDPEELLEYLFRELEFPTGVFLLTGTGIVPPTEFTLSHGDVIRVSIDGIGTLENTVGRG